jgi:phenylalanyl-tRNA synthetase beta chain
VTWSFLPAKTAALWGEINPSLELTNPISTDLAVMRPSILPGLVSAAARNIARGYDGGALFEIGPVFHGVEADAQPVNATAIRFGMIGPRHWRGAPASRPVDASDAKADALALLNAIGFPTANLKLHVIPATPAIYHPGQSGQLSLGKDRIVRFGALHPALIEAMDAKGAVVGFEIDWPAVLTLMTNRKDTIARPLLVLPDLQPVTRDFAFLADKTLDAYTLVAAIAAADKALITNVRVFDIYEGKGVSEGHKSIALEVTLQPRETTLTDADLQRISAAITTAAEKLGVKIRG